MSNFNFIESIFEYIIESIIDENNLLYTELDKFPNSLKDYIVFGIQSNKKVVFIHKNEVFESVAASFSVELPEKIIYTYLAEAKTCDNFHSVINKQFIKTQDKIIEEFKNILLLQANHA